MRQFVADAGDEMITAVDAMLDVGLIPLQSC
jgi:hypothetical protein